MACCIRTKGDPAVEAERVRKALQASCRASSYVTVRPLGDIVQNAQASWRLGATMFVAFAVLALVVAAVGLYGVIGYSVAQRMHELGVRVALGAQQRDILWLVVGQSVRFALAGTALGLVVALAQSRWIQPLLFHQSATDPWILAGVAGRCSSLRSPRARRRRGGHRGPIQTKRSGQNSRRPTGPRVGVRPFVHICPPQ